MSKSKILILISGSIAVYKACYLVSKLSQNGFEVKIAISKSALNFVGATTFEALSGSVPLSDAYETGHALDHIYLMRWADIVIACPATGNFINKIANGIADDLISTLALAHDYTKPFLIAPAMNTQMYLNPITQKSVNLLSGLGFEILETASGVLACKEEGSGKLLDPDLIFDAILNALKLPKNISIVPKAETQKILITSGGTIEAIDNVRAITNTSTGATGAKLAETLSELGFAIDFVSAAKSKKPNCEYNAIEFTDFKSLEQALNSLNLSEYKAIIHTAAVSDYSVEGVYSNGNKISGDKISSDLESLDIKLIKNPKLINSFKKRAPNTLLFGFKLVSENDAKLAVQKQIDAAQSDFIIQNSTKDINGNKAKHVYNIYDKTGEKINIIEGAQNLGGLIAVLIGAKNDTGA